MLCSEIFSVSGLHMNRRQPVAAPILFSFCTSRMASCYGYKYRYIYIYTYIVIYIMLMLRYYNYTRIYIVKYRQSIAIGSIYIGGHFLGSREGEKPQKTLKSRTSCHLSLF